MKTILAATGLVILLVIGFFGFNSYIYNEKQIDEGVSKDYLDGRYLIDGEFITLTDGVSTVEIPTASQTKTVRYFGNEVRGDFDGDSDEDVAFLITVDGGGSGTFYYAVGAVKVENGYRGTPGVFLGDRIAPQTTNFIDGLVVVNYATRNPGEAFTVGPSAGKSIYLKLDPESMQFGEVVKDFEGEVDMNKFSYGEYGYRCGDGTEFTMHPNERVTEILIKPATSVERIPTLVLAKVQSETGAKYADGDYSFHAHGETAAFTGPQFTTSCSPMQSGEAPFNFGD